MKHLARLSAVALAVMLTSAACSGNNRGPVSYPGGPRTTVVDRNGDGYDDRTGARVDTNRRRRDEVRCNAGNGNGNGNGRCRNGNGNKGNGNGNGRGKGRG
jgi:hypothetical protein